MPSKLPKPKKVVVRVPVPRKANSIIAPKKGYGTKKDRFGAMEEAMRAFFEEEMASVETEKHVDYALEYEGGDGLDYKLTGGWCWITAGKFSVHISKLENRFEEDPGILVEVFPAGREGEEELAAIVVRDSDIPPLPVDTTEEL